MKTFITTAITAIMFTAATTCFANNNAKVIPGHRDCNVCHVTTTHNILRNIKATHRCNCPTCKDLRHFHNDPHHAMKANDTKRCNCPTCKDIRHNEMVMRDHKMACNHMAAPAPHTPAPAPHKVVAPNRTGDKVVSGRR